MFKLVQRQLKWLLLSPKFYLAILLTGCAYGFYSIKLSEFSTYLGEPVNILEGWVYCSSSADAVTISILALLFLFSNTPFSSENQSFEIIRLSKKKWLGAKLLYLFFAVSIFYIFLAVNSLLLVSGQAFIANMWSDPIYQLSIGNMGLNTSSQLLFGIMNIIKCFTPGFASGMSLVLLVLYSFLCLSVLTLLNMKLPRGISLILSVLIQAAGYTIFTRFKKYMEFSPLTRAILNNYQSNSLNSEGLSLIHSLVIFTGAIIVILALIFVFVQKVDIQRLLEDE